MRVSASDDRWVTWHGTRQGSCVARPNLLYLPVSAPRRRLQSSGDEHGDRVGGCDFFAAQRRLRWQSPELIAGLFLLLWVIVNWLSGIHTTKTCTTKYDCKTTYDLSIFGLVVTALVVCTHGRDP